MSNPQPDAVSVLTADREITQSCRITKGKATATSPVQDHGVPESIRPKSLMAQIISTAPSVIQPSEMPPNPPEPNTVVPAKPMDTETQTPKINQGSDSDGVQIVKDPDEYSPDDSIPEHVSEYLSNLIFESCPICGSESHRGSLCKQRETNQCGVCGEHGHGGKQCAHYSKARRARTWLRHNRRDLFDEKNAKYPPYKSKKVYKKRLRNSHLKLSSILDLNLPQLSPDENKPKEEERPKKRRRVRFKKSPPPKEPEREPVQEHTDPIGYIPSHLSGAMHLCKCSQVAQKTTECKQFGTIYSYSCMKAGDGSAISVQSSTWFALSLYPGAFTIVRQRDHVSSPTQMADIVRRAYTQMRTINIHHSSSGDSQIAQSLVCFVPELGSYVWMTEDWFEAQSLRFSNCPSVLRFQFLHLTPVHVRTIK